MAFRTKHRVTPVTRLCAAFQPGDVAGLEALGLTVVEDACAAPGAERGGRRVGAQGVMGTFSFFFSHHITTIEGGIVVLNDPGLTDLLRSLRAHGWVRERGDAAPDIIDAVLAWPWALPALSRRASP